MDTTLVTVTVISLSMAFAMGIVTWRLLREERRRADARVAVLMADLAAQSDPPAVWREPRVDPVGRTARAAPGVAPRIRTTEPTPPRRQSALARPAARPTRVTTAAGTPPVPTAPSPTELFAPIAGASVSLRPFVVTVTAAVVVLATVSFTMLFGLPGGDVPADPGTGSAQAVELLSLAHIRQGDYLAITGSIRNPPDGIERGQLSVTAIVFDRDGTVLGTGHTPLPVTVLAPGTETPFTISLPDAERISRYRISFTQGQDNVPHIDRRPSLPRPAARGARGRLTTPTMPTMTMVIK